MKTEKTNNKATEEQTSEIEKETAECPAEESVTAPESDLAAQAAAEAEEYKRLAQRIQAEFDNFRKRNADSVRAARIEGSNEIILSMLPIIDSFDIAVGMIKESESLKGFELMRKKFSELLAKYGIAEIEALGQTFDPGLHNAILQEEDSENAGKIVEVMQKGYTRDGKVLRYAMVKVAK